MDRRLLDHDFDETAANVKKLSQAIQHISRQTDLIGGLDDTPQFRQKLTTKILDSSQTVLAVKKTLEAVQSSGSDRRWKRLEQQFIANFEKLQNLAAVVRSKFSNTGAQPSPQKARSGNSNDTLLKQQNNNGYGTTYASQQQQQQQQQQEQEHIFQEWDSVVEIENYEEQLYEILQNLQELYESYCDLKMLIDDQDEPIQILSDNANSAADQVKSGVDQLDKAASHQRRYRGKLCTFMIILLIIAVIVTVIVILNSKNK